MLYAIPKEEYDPVIHGYEFGPLHNRSLRIHVSLHQRPDPAVPSTSRHFCFFDFVVCRIILGSRFGARP